MTKIYTEDKNKNEHLKKQKAEPKASTIVALMAFAKNLTECSKYNNQLVFS